MAMRPRTLLCASVALAAVALASGASQPAFAKTPKDQLIVGMNMANLTSLDPHNMNSYKSHHILANVYDTLVRTDPKDPAVLMPRIAESSQGFPTVRSSSRSGGT